MVKGKNGRYFQGKFRPLNPNKYAGDVNDICYRSGWEFQAMCELDKDPNVLQWGSEIMHIKYYNPADRKWHRYFPDFIVKRKTPEGIRVFMIEIKPEKETRPPLANKKGKKSLRETHKYVVNQAKWQYAEAYCKRAGITFQVLTEKHLFKK